MKRPRDAERTRAEILAAAAVEFAEHGLAGARVDTIAERSTSSKRMIYYYYGSKEALFQAVLASKLSDRFHAPAAPQDGYIEHLIAAQRITLRDPDYLRLLQWEALDTSARPSDLVPDPKRAAVYSELVSAVRADQARGALPVDLDASHLALSLLGLALFPYLLPQLTRLFTGTEPTDPAWLANRDDFLHALSANLTKAAAT